MKYTIGILPGSLDGSMVMIARDGPANLWSVVKVRKQRGGSLHQCTACSAEIAPRSRAWSPVNQSCMFRGERLCETCVIGAVPTHRYCPLCWQLWDDLLQAECDGDSTECADTVGDLVRVTPCEVEDCQDDEHDWGHNAHVVRTRPVLVRRYNGAKMAFECERRES